MGEPGWGNTQSLLPESIGQVEGTRGTETSKYPEEKKEKSILLVAASEEGRGQTDCLRTIGVAGQRHEKISDPNELESSTRDGDSPVGEVENI